MPTYSYQCAKCDHLMQVFHSMTAKPRVKCEECGSTRVKRLLGAGAGIIFKGSGFYETDYKSKGKGKSGEAAKSTSGSEAKSEKKSESSSTKKESGSKSKSTEAA
ncbi:MAG: zinc ribbon domain-containing protein [bacterium]|nr:zinc ribbon domain-containing protein [bacterium]